MKTWMALFATGMFLSFGVPQSQARVEVTLDFFFDALDPYGDWIYVDDYGYCFQPAVTIEDSDWRPYADGYWTYTDCGWTWVSHEDFGWACYHYGRWSRLNRRWVWVPGYDWGPAWVSWRRGGDYVGWAPLPPEAEWDSGREFRGWVDDRFDIGPRHYSFVPMRHFGASRLRPVIVAPERNLTIIRQTTNITHITHRETNVNITNIYNQGPDFDEVNRLAARKIRRMRIDARDDVDVDSLRRGRGARARLEGEALVVSAPDVRRPQGKVAPAKVAGRASRAEINRGWQGVPDDEAQQWRRHMKTEVENAQVDSPTRQPDTAKVERPKASDVAAPPAESVPQIDEEIKSGRRTGRPAVAVDESETPPGKPATPGRRSETAAERSRGDIDDRPTRAREKSAAGQSNEAASRPDQPDRPAKPADQPAKPAVQPAKSADEPAKPAAQPAKPDVEDARRTAPGPRAERRDEQPRVQRKRTETPRERRETPLTPAQEPGAGNRERPDKGNGQRPERAKPAPPVPNVERVAPRERRSGRVDQNDGANIRRPVVTTRPARSCGGSTAAAPGGGNPPTAAGSTAAESGARDASTKTASGARGPRNASTAAAAGAQGARETVRATCKSASTGRARREEKKERRALETDGASAAKTTRTVMP